MAAVTFDQALDFTRGSEGTYIGPDGLIKTAAADEPRFTHDPVTREPLGLLIEEQRTNLLLWSEDFTRWVPVGGAIIASPNSAIAPDGQQAADIIQCGGLDIFFRRRDSFSDTGQSVTHSLYVKNVDSTYAEIRPVSIGGTTSDGGVTRFQFSSESFILVGLNIDDYGFEKLPNGWYRIWATVTMNGTNPSVEHRVSCDSQIAVWGAAVEDASTTPSSYIPTTGAQVTRAADNVSRVLGAEFNPGSFSVIARGIQSAGVAGSTQRLLSINNGSNNERLVVSRNSLVTAVGGSPTTTINVASIPNNANVGIAYDGAILTISVNGVTWFSGPRILNPDQFTQIQIGRDSSIAARGVSFEHIKILPRALSEAELNTLAAPEAYHAT